MYKGNSIYYAVNNSAKYIYLARKSIESIRRFDKEIDIQLFVYGQPPHRSIGFAKKLKVKVHVMKAVPKKLNTFLKWLALPKMTQYERVLFADADTCFFSHPKKLFSKYKTKDFYAREEFGTNPGKTTWSIFGKLQFNQLDHRLYAKITKTLGVKSLPIFNTGVMIFNNLRKTNTLSQLEQFKVLQKRFASKKIPNPITGTPHILDEICASLVFGGIKNFKWGFITADDSPWYYEWREGRVKSRGIILHTWTAYWPAFCFDNFGEGAVVDYADWTL